MPTTITEFNSPITFNTVWIFVKDTSDLDGLDNNEVPRALSTKQSVKGSWGLYVNGIEQQKNQASEIFEIVGGGNYTVGDRILSKTYRKTTDNLVTANETIIGTITAGSSGTGIIEGTPNLEETAWLVKFPTGADPISKILWQGSIIFEGNLQQHNRNTTGIDQPFGQNFYPLPEDLTVDKYTRGEFQYQNGEGWQVHKIAKKEPDSIVTETTNVPILQDTFYEFYNVIWTTESEVSNFSASAALILPVHLLQRTLSQRSSDRKINGLDLKESFIRVAADMSSAGVQVQDLYNNYGIEAYAIPITLNIGGNAVSLAINQIVDVDVNNQQDNDVLKYVAAVQKWQNTPLATVALSGSYYDLVDEPPVPQISTLTDVIITNDGTSANTLADGNILQWNNTLSVWENVGGISSTSILDFDTTVSATGDVLQRDNAGVYQSAPLFSDTVVEGSNNLYFSEQRARESFTTTPNKLHMDYDLLSDRSDNVAISSLQSIVMFLDTNNSEDGNYFGLFNNEDEITTTLSKESAIFRVEENGDIYSDGTLHVDGEIIGRNIGNSTNYATSQGWQAGAAETFSLQTGYYGGDFLINGEQVENSVIWGPSPLGNRSLLWQTIGGHGNGTSDPDGGWSKSIGNLPSSQDHAYLSYVYVMRTSSTIGGGFYHGCANCLNSNGTVNNNPYFVDNLAISQLPQDIWCVSIGIILAHSDTATSPTPDIIGLYRLDTGARITTTTPIFRSKSSGPTAGAGSHGAIGVEMQAHRAYHYYSADATSALAFAKPGFHVIDGNEPSLNMLLN